MSGQTASEMVRMGAIEERRTLNPREHLSHEAIQEYVRRLENGEVPPPIQVHRGKGVIFAGAHRFHAYKAHYGENWESAEIAVVWRDDLPDPDDEPERFRMLAAADNRNNGVILSRMDKKRLAKEFLHKFGWEETLKYASDLNETPESLRKILDIFGQANQAQAKALEQLPESPPVTPRPTDQEATPPVVEPPASQDAHSSHPASGKFVPESQPTGYLRSSWALIRASCRQLLQRVRPCQGNLTDAELVELRALYLELGRILHDEAAA